jgi:hypothetical protein
MFRSRKNKAMPSVAPRTEPDAVQNMAAMTGKLGLDTAPAAWPTGVSLLAQAVASCQRCEAAQVCADWLARAPEAVDAPPPFCPNAPEFTRAKKRT